MGQADERCAAVAEMACATSSPTRCTQALILPLTGESKAVGDLAEMVQAAGGADHALFILRHGSGRTT